ncbi:MAG: low temperature requirement protein A [Acidimicrobiia bacterium]
MQWLELFFDLIMVAAVLLLSSAYEWWSSSSDTLWIVAVFIAIWFGWLNATLYVNRFPTDAPWYRYFVLVQMFLIAVVAMAASDGIRAHSGITSITYGVLTASYGLPLWFHRHGEHARYARVRSRQYLVAAALFIVAGFLPIPAQVVCWVVAAAVLAVPLMWPGHPRMSVSTEHIVERMGALTLIMCGEAFGKVAIKVDNGRLEDIALGMTAALFALIFMIWWCYFADVPNVGLRGPATSARRTAWMGSHLVLHLMIVGLAIGAAHFITLGHGDVPAKYIAQVAIPLAAFFVMLGVISALSGREPTAPLAAVRIGAAVLTFVIGYACWKLTWFDNAWALFAFVVLAGGTARLSRVAMESAIPPAAMVATNRAPGSDKD